MAKAPAGSSHERVPRINVADYNLHSDPSGYKDTLHTQIGHCSTLSDGQATHGLTTPSKEINDAEMMIQTMPGLLTGYTRAGELYSLLGYQQRAMKVYQQGFSNTDSKYHDILRQQYETAKAKDEVRVNILDIIPYDIIVHIVKYVTTNDHLVLLDVSKAWREILYDCPSIWQTIKISDLDTLSETAIPRLGHFGSHILDVTAIDTGIGHSEALIGQLLTGNFNKLTSLYLHNCDIPSNDVLINALARVSGTLKKLDFVRMPCEILYKSILATCVNLECFTYVTTFYLMDDTTGSLGAAYTSKLTDLHIHSFIITQENIQDILCCSPELRHLNIGQYCPIPIMNTALSECKKLETLIFGNYGWENYNQTWLNRNQRMSTSSTGLRTLAANILDDPQNFIPVFTNHCSTIEVLQIGIAALSPDQWMPLVNGFGNFSRLQSLELYCDHIQGCNAAADLLRKSPVLTRLSCYFECADVGSNIITAIIAAPNMKELEIVDPRFNEQDLRTLLQGFVAKGSQLSTLQRVAFTDSFFGFPVIAALENLPDIPTLKEFELDYCSSATEPMIANFCNRMRSHPSIETIKFGHLTCITDATLKIIAAIKSLKYLKLDTLGNITKQGTRVFSSSVKLEIVNCPEVK